MTATAKYNIDPHEFRDRQILVTGGTKGIGQAIVQRFVEGGASVATTGRSALPEGQTPALFVPADVSTPGGVNDAVERVLAEWGGIDILVNCVGGSDAPSGGFSALDDGLWAAALDLNLMSAVRLDRALVPGMIERGRGVVLHVSSIQHACRSPTRRSPTRPPRRHYAPTARGWPARWGPRA